jgi:HprK-related kinase B
MDEPTRKSLVEGFRAAYPPTDELLVGFGECRIAVETNSRDLRQALAEYYGGFLEDGPTVDIRITVHEAPAQALALPFVVKPPDPGKTKVKEEYVDLPDGRVVRKRLTGMLFAFGNGDHLAVGPCLENTNQIVNFVNNRYIEWRLCRGCFLGHAAGVALNGRGVALAGFSGMGKSTLALHLMSRGTLFVSNDRMIVERAERGLTMHGVAKQPRINPGTALANPDLAGILVPQDRDRFSRLSEAELWDLEYKYDVPIETCFGSGRFVLTSPMNALVILNWQRGGEALAVRRVVPAERKELLSAFRKKKGLFYLPSNGAKVQDPSLDSYAELLSDCTVVEMAGGADFQGAVEACLRLLEGDDV